MRQLQLYSPRNEPIDVDHLQGPIKLPSGANVYKYGNDYVMLKVEYVTDEALNEMRKWSHTKEAKQRRKEYEQLAREDNAVHWEAKPDDSTSEVQTPDVDTSTSQVNNWSAIPDVERDLNGNWQVKGGY